MEICWSNKIYLSALVNRFVKLSLQLISRYRTWLEIGLNNVDFNSIPVVNKPIDSTKVSTETKTENDNKDGSIMVLFQFGMKEWIGVCYDLDKLRTHISAHFFEYVKPRISHLSEELGKFVKGIKIFFLVSNSHFFFVRELFTSSKFS